MSVVCGGSFWEYQLFCVQDDYSLSPTTLGRIASYYYLSHSTVRMFKDKLTPNGTIPELITFLAVRNHFHSYYTTSTVAILLLLGPKADTHFTVTRRVEGWVDLGAAARAQDCKLQ